MKILIKNILVVFIALLIVIGTMYLSLYLSIKFLSVIPFFTFLAVCMLSLFLLVWTTLWSKFVKEKTNDDEVEEDEEHSLCDTCKYRDCMTDGCPCDECNSEIGIYNKYEEREAH